MYTTTLKIANQKINFGGTTIIKGEGGSILNKEILKAVNYSTNGYSNTRLNGYSMIVVADVFEKEEAAFLKGLRKNKIPYVNFSNFFNYKTSSIEELMQIVNNVVKTGLI